MSDIATASHDGNKPSAFRRFLTITVASLAGFAILPYVISRDPCEQPSPVLDVVPSAPDGVLAYCLVEVQSLRGSVQNMKPLMCGQDKAQLQAEAQARKTRSTDAGRQCRKAQDYTPMGIWRMIGGNVLHGLHRLAGTAR